MLTMETDLGEGVFWRARYARPDPVRDPDGYMRWLVTDADPGPLQPLSFPMIDESYVIGPSAAPAKKHWYVVVTEPKREGTVAEEIEHIDDGRRREGVEVLNIRLKTIESRRGVRRVVERALFPRYVFAGLASPPAGLALIRTVNGARDVLRASDGAPLVVSPAIIADLRDREARGEFDDTCIDPKGWGADSPQARKWQWITVGTPVRVSTGPFASFIGPVEEIDAGRCIAKIGLSLFGRPCPTHIAFDCIESV